MDITSKNHVSLLPFVVVTAVLMAGCEGSTPTLDTSDETQMTFDGLYPVKGGTADEAWARPGIDISQYSKIMLQGVGIEYRPGGETRRTSMSLSRADHYEIDAKQRERFEAVVRETFVDEMSRSEHFTIVSEPGPDVLLIRGGLFDVESYVPPEPIGRGAIYLRSVGEATLVLELRDSESGAILARAVDRRAAEDALGMQESNRVNNTAEVKRLVRTWGRLLRERLDTYAAPQE